MHPPLRPAEILRQRLRDGAYEEVRNEVRAHPDAGLDHQKCLCDALAQLREWQDAIAVAEAHLGTDSYFTPLLLAKFSQNAGDNDACWRWLERAREQEGESIGYLTTASKLAFAEGDTERAVAFGQQVLTLKDGMLSGGLTGKLLSGGTAKILSFSLFGTREVYLFGALANARLWRRKAPDWTCRFYVTHDVPVAIIQALTQLGAEVVVHRNPAIPAYMARFLPLSDPKVARFACRDVDCRPSDREVEILREWENSGRAFHAIRNHPLHTDLVLAGLWGGVPLQGFDLAAEIAACFPMGASNKYGLDQRFLEQRVWARIRTRVLAHDAYYRLDGIETRPVNDPKLGLGHQNPEGLPAELQELGIRVSRKA